MGSYEEGCAGDLGLKWCENQDSVWLIKPNLQAEFVPPNPDPNPNLSPFWCGVVSLPSAHASHQKPRILLWGNVTNGRQQS